MRGLLTADGREGADAALSLEVQEAFVEAPPQHHGPVELEQQFPVNVGIALFVDVALGIEYRQAFDAFIQFDVRTWHYRLLALLAVERLSWPNPAGAAIDVRAGRWGAPPGSR